MIPCLLHAADGPSDNGFEHRAPIIMQEMDFIDDEEPNEVGITGIRAFPRDDIPFLWRGGDDLGVAAIRTSVICESPVSSPTRMPNADSLAVKLPTVSCTNAFIGAT